MRAFQWAAFSAVLLAGPVAAAPVYLSCYLESAEKGPHFEVTLDEAAGTASYVLVETGLSGRGIKALFSPTAVEWKEPAGYFVTTYSINRQTLVFKENLPMNDTSISRSGICKVAPVPDRKF